MRISPLPKSSSHLTLERLQPPQKLFRQNPAFTSIQNDGHHTHFHNQPRGEWAEVSLKYSNTTIQEETSSGLLQILLHCSGCHLNPTPPVTRAFPHITSREHLSIHITLWKLVPGKKTLPYSGNLTFLCIKLQEVLPRKPLHHCNLASFPGLRTALKFVACSTKSVVASFPGSPPFFGESLGTRLIATCSSKEDTLPAKVISVQEATSIETVH